MSAAPCVFPSIQSLFSEDEMFIPSFIIPWTTAGSAPASAAAYNPKYFRKALAQKGLKLPLAAWFTH